MILSFIPKRLSNDYIKNYCCFNFLDKKNCKRKKLRDNTEIISPDSSLPGNLIVSAIRFSAMSFHLREKRASIILFLSLFSVAGVSWRVINRRRRRRRIISKYKAKTCARVLSPFLSSRVTGDLRYVVEYPYMCTKHRRATNIYVFKLSAVSRWITPLWLIEGSR